MSILFSRKISSKDNKQRAVFFLSLYSFLPGVVPEQPLSTSPVKRRTQSLSALPKDGDKSSPGKVVASLPTQKHPESHCSFSSNIKCNICLFFLLACPEGEGPHPATDECLHDFQQAPQSIGAPAASKPGQQDGQQDSWGVVVCSGTQGEAKVPRSGLPGTSAENTTHKMNVSKPTCRSCVLLVSTFFSLSLLLFPGERGSL